MKTLVNKDNPQIRITAPEFKISGTGRYYIPVKRYCTLTWLPENWTLVEEEPKHTEVWVEGRTIFEQDAKKSEVDLEEAAFEYGGFSPLHNVRIDAFKAGAKWQKQRDKEWMEAKEKEY